MKWAHHVGSVKIYQLKEMCKLWQIPSLNQLSRGEGLPSSSPYLALIGAHKTKQKAKTEVQLQLATHNSKHVLKATGRCVWLNCIIANLISRLIFLSFVSFCLIHTFHCYCKLHSCSKSSCLWHWNPRIMLTGLRTWRFTNVQVNRPSNHFSMYSVLLGSPQLPHDVLQCWAMYRIAVIDWSLVYGATLCPTIPVCPTRTMPYAM